MSCKFKRSNSESCRVCVCVDCPDTERCEQWHFCTVDECDCLPGSQGRNAVGECWIKNGVKLANGEVEYLYKLMEVE